MSSGEIANLKRLARMDGVRESVVMFDVTFAI